MANSRILDASRIRVNSLGPEAAGGAFTAGSVKLGAGRAVGGAGYAAIVGGACGGAQSGAFAAGAGGSLGVERDAKVWVQTPGCVPGAGLGGGASLCGAGAFAGSSNI